MEEALSMFQSLVEAEQRNGRPYQKRTLAENKNPDSRSNQEQGMDKAIQRHKGVESHPVDVGVQSRAYTCG